MSKLNFAQDQIYKSHLTDTIFDQHRSRVTISEVLGLLATKEGWVEMFKLVQYGIMHQLPEDISFQLFYFLKKI